MIPVRVSLRNFLCYDDIDGEPVEFDFDGSSLWSISGDNGAGKSAIFDAITYTLFGRHRGGSQRDSRLIRRGAGQCEAQFEFLLDGQLYRVRRTVGRPRRAGGQEAKTRQASWFDAEADDWRPIPDTEREDELSNWVEKALGFGYDTFVASVLLLQGQSDRLITEDARKRFEILSGILEMEAYKRLEDAASRHASDARKEVNVLEQQLSAMPLVPTEEVKVARDLAKGSTKLLKAAQTALEQAIALKADAGRHEVLTGELERIRNSLAEIGALLDRAKEVPERYQEWRRLSSAVPLCRDALGELEEAKLALDESQSARELLKGLDMGALRGSIDACAKAVQAARSTERGLRKAHQEFARGRPILRELVRCRRGLLDRDRQATEASTPQECQLRLQNAVIALNTQQRNHEQAEKARKDANDEVARTTATLQHTKAQLTNRLEAKGEAVCSRCGQRVTAEHIKQEIDDAQKAVSAAQLDHDDRQAAAKRANRALQATKEPLKRLAEDVSQAELAEARALSASKEKDKASEELSRAVAAAESTDPEIRRVLIEDPVPDAEATMAGIDSCELEMRQQLEEAEETTRGMEADVAEAQQNHDNAVGRSQELQTAAAKMEEQAKGLRAKAEVRLADVDQGWRERTLASDRAFVDVLEVRLRSLDGAEGEHKQLEEAESERTQLMTRAQAVGEEIEKIPASHQVGVKDALAIHGKAQGELDMAQKARDNARSKLQHLEEAQERRSGLEDQANVARRRRVLYSRLAELLGRSGLQAYLMDAALEGIDRLANETLARISGGQLQVRLAREPNGKGEEEITIRALDLASSDEPLDIQFISGGQKFRTSVALAAGIGQYASGSKDSVRSLIIDEGFGSLDSHGRQEMIEELQNLSQLMDRIIVVSHQEDFQDRTLFPTGYVLRKAGQRTTVEKFV